MLTLDDLTLKGVMPPRATDWALTVDIINAVITWASVFLTVAITGAMIYFALKARHKDGAKASYIPHNTTLETVWTVVPAIVCIVLFYAGFAVYREQRTPPLDAIDIYVRRQKWAWNFAYPGGKKSTNELIVPVDKPVRLIMKSNDVLHSFFIPSMRMKEDVVGSFYTYLWFKPNTTGEFPIFCAEYCGMQHSAMLATLKVVSYEEYQDYLWKKPAEQLPPLELGQKLYKEQQCISCHSLDGSRVVGPTFKGLFGSTRKFTDGSTATADENYIKHSLEEPGSQVVEGFAPAMPAFKDILSDDDIEGLITFIKSLK